MNYNEILQTRNNQLKALISKAETFPKAEITYQDISENFLNGTLNEIRDNNIAKIKPYAFYGYSSLALAYLYYCSTIGEEAFAYCRNLRNIHFPLCQMVGSSAFYYCSSLYAVDLPRCNTIFNNAFDYCTFLTIVNLPACSTIGSYAFYNASRLGSLEIPQCKQIGSCAFAYCDSLNYLNIPLGEFISNEAFYRCDNLETLVLPKCKSIGTRAFLGCYNLSNIYLADSTVCALTHSNALQQTPFAGYSSSFSGTPYIYVPSSLITKYQSATNWVYFSSYFSAINNIITFTCNFGLWEKAYQAEQNMTWSDWVNSSYNTDGFIIENNKIYHPNYEDTSVSSVYASDVIIANNSYHIYTGWA